MQTNAVTAQQNLAMTDQMEDRLVNLGILPSLIELLLSAAGPLQNRLAGTLRAFFTGNTIRRQAAELGALPPLIALSACTSSDGGEAAQICLQKLALTLLSSSRSRPCRSDIAKKHWQCSQAENACKACEALQGLPYYGASTFCKACS